MSKGNSKHMIPQDFESWKDCIQNKCGIPLTIAFAQSRIVIYENKNLPENQRFIGLYGEEHYHNILNWLYRIVHSSVIL